MTYEQAAFFFAALSLLISVLSYVRSGKGISIQERQAIVEEAAHAMALKNFGYPIFKVGFTAARAGASPPSLKVLLHNPGGYVLHVNEAHVTLHSYKYPQADITTELRNRKIAAGGDDVFEIGFQDSYISRQGTEEFSAELQCYASYKNADGHDDEANETYKYSTKHYKWVQSKE